MVTHEVERNLAVSLTMEDGLAPPINHDPLIGPKVMRAIDLRVLKIFPNRWIYVTFSPTLTILGEQGCHGTKSHNARVVN
jgi:hypothetical protein